MSWVAAAIGGSALIGAGAGIFSSNKAAKAQESASRAALEVQNRGLDFQNRTYNETQANLRPFRMAGEDALSRIAAMRSGSPDSGWQDFIRSPDYQFRFNEGNRAFENSAAARGGLLSGNAIRGQTQFGQNFAAGEFGNYWNRLFNQAQLGQQAATGAGGLATNQAGQIGNTTQGISNTIQGIGQAQASGIVGGANALTGAVGSGVQNYLLMNYLNRSSYGGGGSQLGWAPSPNGGVPAPMYG